MALSAMSRKERSMKRKAIQVHEDVHKVITNEAKAKKISVNQELARKYKVKVKIRKYTK